MFRSFHRWDQSFFGEVCIQNAAETEKVWDKWQDRKKMRESPVDRRTENKAKTRTMSQRKEGTKQGDKRPHLQRNNVMLHYLQEVFQMEPGLISKKELLELTGISYGQLYRWKRKQLIPEEWFIRKSTFTGQETFFPKDKILIRIDKILNMKEDLSLDELADMFSPNAAELSLTKEDLIKRNIVTEVSLNFYLEQTGDSSPFPFERILQLFVLDKMLKTGEMSLDEGKMLLQIFQDHYASLEGKKFDLMFVRKLGISTFLLIESDSRVYLERNTKIVQRLNLNSCIEELKLQIG